MDLIVQVGDEKFECEAWDEFLNTWEEYGDKFVNKAVADENFMPWLNSVQPNRAFVLSKVFKGRKDLIENLFLTVAFLRMREDQIGLCSREDSKPGKYASVVSAALEDPLNNAEVLISFLETETVDFLPNAGEEREAEVLRRQIALFRQKIRDVQLREKRKEASRQVARILGKDDNDSLAEVFANW